jgi:hypothetical protein
MRIRGVIVLISVVLAGCGGGGGGLVDTTPPTISRVEMEWVAQTLYVSVAAQDAESGIASVSAQVRVGTQTQTVLLQASGASQYRAALPNGTTRVTITARDRAGNERTSGELIAPAAEPTVLASTARRGWNSSPAAPKTPPPARCPRPLTAESAQTLRGVSGCPPAGSSPRAHPSTRAPHACLRC